MSTAMDKLIRAKELILEVEEELIENRKFCPYEIGYALRKLDEAINQVSQAGKKAKTKEEYSNDID